MEEKFYKPLVETPDGRLISIWAGRTAGAELEYKEGQITYTPEGGGGIWVCTSLEGAERQGRGNKSKVGVLVIYEVTLLGERCGALYTASGILSFFSSDTRYPAILIGKEVWRAEPEKPKEVWEDVTRECEVKISSSSPHWVSIIYKRTEIFLLGSNGVMEWKSGWKGDNYQIEVFPTGGLSYECGGFKVWKKVS